MYRIISRLKQLVMDVQALLPHDFGNRHCWCCRAKLNTSNLSKAVWLLLLLVLQFVASAWHADMQHNPLHPWHLSKILLVI